MSATGTSPFSVELYGAGAQTYRRAAALLHGRAIIKLWEELGFLYLRPMMCAVISYSFWAGWL